jgi:hypothetical protein
MIGFVCCKARDEGITWNWDQETAGMVDAFWSGDTKEFMMDGWENERLCNSWKRYFSHGGEGGEEKRTGAAIIYAALAIWVWFWWHMRACQNHCV